MEEFEGILAQYDFLIRKVLRHMRIYENFEEYYHIATIALWEATTTYCAEKSIFEKYAFLQMKYRIAAELSHSKKDKGLLLTDESFYFEQPVTAAGHFDWAWFELLSAEEQQLIYWLFVDQYRNREIAHFLRISEEAVKKRRQRLMRKLKQVLLFK